MQCICPSGSSAFDWTRGKYIQLQDFHGLTLKYRYYEFSQSLQRNRQIDVEIEFKQTPRFHPHVKSGKTKLGIEGINLNISRSIAEIIRINSLKTSPNFWNFIVQLKIQMTLWPVCRLFFERSIANSLTIFLRSVFEMFQNENSR